MPGPITWRDVAAPDISTSVQALGLAGKSLADAGTEASSALGAFQANRQADATNLLAQKVASFSDPDALKAAVAADPTLGVNPNLVTAAAMKGVQDHVDSLLANAQTGANTAGITEQTKDASDADARAQLTSNNAETDRNKILAAAPDFNKAISLAASNPEDAGTQITARKMLADASTKYGLTPDQFMAGIKGTQEIAGKDVSTDNDILNGKRTVAETANIVRTGTGIDTANDSSAFALKTAKQNQADLDSGKALIVATTEGTDPADPTTAIAAYNSAANSGKYTPGAKLIAMEDLSRRYPGNAQVAALAAQSANAANGLGPIGVGGNGSGNADFNATYNNVGKDGPPIVGMTIGQAVNYGNNVLIPKTRGQVGAGPDKGTSAMGGYQLLGGTIQKYAPKVGLTAQDQMTPVNQDKIAEAVFNDNKSSAASLTAQWPSLKKYGSGTVSKITQMPWEQARNYITQGESGGPVQVNYGQAATDAINGLLERQSDDASGISVANLATATQDQKSQPIDIANKLASQYGGKPADYIDNITQVMHQTGKNAAVAGVLLNNSIKSAGSGGLLSSLFGSRNNIGDKGFGIDTGTLNDNIKSIQTGSLGKGLANYTSQASSAASLSALQAQNAQAEAALQSAQRAVQSGQRGMINQIPLLAQRVAQTRASMMSALMLVRSHQAAPPAPVAPFSGPLVSLKYAPSGG